jgi:hypothetical protein
VFGRNIDGSDVEVKIEVEHFPYDIQLLLHGKWVLYET